MWETLEQRALKRACETYELALAELEEAARDYARAETLKASARWPARTLRYVSAMGSSCLHVTRKGTYGAAVGDYQMYAGDGSNVHAPDFLAAINDIESRYNFQFALGGPVYITAKAGALVSEKEDW